MAKQIGIIKLQGTLGGLTFYQSNGRDIVRTLGTIDKKRIEKDPNFRRRRENMSEFGAASMVGKEVRQRFKAILKNVKGVTISGRLTGTLRRMIALGSGASGQRNLEIVKNKILLKNFEFNIKIPFNSVVQIENTPPKINKNRNKITWTISDFNTSKLIKAPEGATHFKLILATTVLSNYQYNTKIKKYQPTENIENKTTKITYSPIIAVNNNVEPQTKLTTSLSKTVPTKTAIINATGIIFYQKVNTKYYQLSTGNAMKISTIE